MSSLIYVIDEFQSLYGICPCCGEIFRLSDAKLKFPSVALKNDPVFKLNLLESKVLKQQELLSLYQSRMDEAYERARAKAQDHGRKRAKRSLRKIDPIFTGRDIDIQDVKTVFDPVEFIVFDKMNSVSGIIKGIELIALEPKSRKRELVLKSIEKTIGREHYNFKIIRIDKQGEIS